MNLALAVREAFGVSQRDAVERLQDEMAKMPQVELPTEHLFADGMYCRVLPRKAGTLIVGKVHKKEHFYMVVQGRVLVTTDEGAREIAAPKVIVSSPGTKRAVFAIEDSVCLTVHSVSSRDLAEIENEIVENAPGALFDFENKLKSPALEHSP